MQQIQIQQPTEEIQKQTNTYTTIMRGNMKCKKYKYNNHRGKHEMRHIQLQQSSGEIQNPTNKNTNNHQGKYNYWHSIK